MKGWRTVIFNLVGLGLAFAVRKGWITADPDLQNTMTEIAIAALAGGNVWLRTLTTTPIGRKK